MSEVSGTRLYLGNLPRNGMLTPRSPKQLSAIERTVANWKFNKCLYWVPLCGRHLIRGYTDSCLVSSYQTGD